MIAHTLRQAFLILLGRLPWPWGEEILSQCFVAAALARPSRRRQALAWAAAHVDEGRWSFARSLCAFHGRIVARSALVGIGTAERLADLVEVRGASHLVDARGSLLLGFHLGPRDAYLALRLRGHRVTWLGGPGAGARWATDIRTRHRARSDALIFSKDRASSVARFYRARAILREGGHVFVNADGDGERGFTVDLPGRPLMSRLGWLTLRRLTGVPVLPVLSHFEGRTHVVTVHPPLPADLDDCRRALGELLGEYVRRYPQQCYSLAFPTGRPVGAPATR